VLDALDHLSPGKGIRPLADGMGLGNDVGNPKAGNAPTKPMLQGAYQRHRESSFSMGTGGIRRRRHTL
jgi:hypothetical protein